MSETIHYQPPATLREFIKHHRQGELFYSWVVGPVGSGKTTALFFKLVYMAKLQAPNKEGIRKSRAVIVRNTMSQLRDTTIASWNYWFKAPQAGEWKATTSTFVLKFDDVECEVLFRPLDTPDDVERVLSLEVSFAIIDEFVNIPRAIIEALSARVGRFPGSTNWGIWGSSNPDTEDNWWYDYLHYNIPENARYFLQPSGFSPNAENVENLPGQRKYYENLAKGRKEAWIKQFLEAEWGFSISGKPVVESFRSDMHVSHQPLLFQPGLDLVVGVDPGLGGSAFIFGQEDLHGRLLVLGELVQSGMGAKRLISERLEPYLKKHFPTADVVLAPDPAAANRSSTDEKSIVQVLREKFNVKIETNNRLPKRLDAIEHYTSRLTDVGPALLIDEKACPILLRALKGGWRFVMDEKKEIIKSPEPEKNQYSHPGDAFGYLCRYFHAGAEKYARHKSAGVKPFVIPRTFGPSYHFR